jgi:branched-chain amino acid transport system substrate-binding protein
MNLYRAVTEKYNSSEDLSTFGQMGFLSGKIYADTLQELPASQLNRAGINKAIGEIEDYETDMLCEPWSFGSGKSHIPVTAGRIFAPENGKLKEVKGCTPLQVVTPGQKAAEAAG